MAAATITLGPEPVLAAAAALPVEALVLGKPVDVVADLLPRLFNLCRAAQGAAARLSMGLPGAGDPAPEVIRDHVLKLCVTLPRAFGLPGVPLPLPLPRAEPGEARSPMRASLPPGGGAMGWGGAVAGLLGPDGLPDDIAALTGPLAPLVAHVACAFPPGVATCAALPAPEDPLAAGAYETSTAGRQSAHPLLRRVERSHGRGPLWRLAAILADLDAARAGRLPVAAVSGGTATVPAARGTYALRITRSDGRVTGLTRRTPTDHLLAPGGALMQALAGLPPALHPLAPQVIALHDPCIPVTVREAQDA